MPAACTWAYTMHHAYIAYLTGCWCASRAFAYDWENNWAFAENMGQLNGPPTLPPSPPPSPPLAWPSSLNTTLPTDDAAYDKARASFNCMVTARPTVIVYPETTEQVQESILMGINRTGSGGVCVRACGHSYSGFSSCDGVLIDVTRLNKVIVGAGGFVTVGA
eukprot:scaffold50680_cov75-Phaeocystis_antarctica.AAC.1